MIWNDEDFMSVRFSPARPNEFGVAVSQSPSCNGQMNVSQQNGRNDVLQRSTSRAVPETFCAAQRLAHPRACRAVLRSSGHAGSPRHALMGTTAAPAGVETLAPRGLTEEAIACNAILNRIPSLCTRVILLTIHDMDLDKAAGATLRAAMAQAKVSMKLQGQFSACLREVRVAQEMAREAYVPIRHATIAHRVLAPTGI